MSRAAASVSAQVEAIVAAAEQTAAQLRDEAEATARRRAAEVRGEAEADAERIRRQAESAREGWLAEARAEIEDHTQERIRAVTQRSDALIEAADAISKRVQSAAAAQRHLEELLAQIRELAARIATEAAEGLGRTARQAPPRAPDWRGQGGEEAAGPSP